jgi:hypothetical protein
VLREDDSLLDDDSLLLDSEPELDDPLVVAGPGAAAFGSTEPLPATVLAQPTTASNVSVVAAAANAIRRRARGPPPHFDVPDTLLPLWPSPAALPERRAGPNRTCCRSPVPHDPAEPIAHPMSSWPFGESPDPAAGGNLGWGARVVEAVANPHHV